MSDKMKKEIMFLLADVQSWLSDNGWRVSTISDEDQILYFLKNAIEEYKAMNN